MEKQAGKRTLHFGTGVGDRPQLALVRLHFEVSCGGTLWWR